MNGYDPGTLVVAAGRPGMGKTAFMNSSAVRCAKGAGVGVLEFPLEVGARPARRRGRRAGRDDGGGTVRRRRAHRRRRDGGGRGGGRGQRNIVDVETTRPRRTRRRGRSSSPPKWWRSRPRPCASASPASSTTRAPLERGTASQPRRAARLFRRGAEAGRPVAAGVPPAATGGTDADSTIYPTGITRAPRTVNRFSIFWPLIGVEL